LFLDSEGLHTGEQIRADNQGFPGWPPPVLERVTPQELHAMMNSSDPDIYFLRPASEVGRTIVPQVLQSHDFTEQAEYAQHLLGPQWRDVPLLSKSPEAPERGVPPLRRVEVERKSPGANLGIEIPPTNRSDRSGPTNMTPDM
jgi:hypothetical protein